MTDAEIIKALEYCKDCSANLNVEIIDLINRQQVEIEGLQKGNEELGKVIAGAYQLNCFLEVSRKCVRKEAIKEFAERLKNEIDIRPTHSNEQNKYVCFLIDNLVKEMAGEE